MPPGHCGLAGGALHPSQTCAHFPDRLLPHGRLVGLGGSHLFLRFPLSLRGGHLPGMTVLTGSFNPPPGRSGLTAGPSSMPLRSLHHTVSTWAGCYFGGTLMSRWLPPVAVLTLLSHLPQLWPPCLRPTGIRSSPSTVWSLPVWSPGWQAGSLPLVQPALSIPWIGHCLGGVWPGLVGSSVLPVPS